MRKTKPFDISKHLFVQAYKLVKVNAGAAGVDKQSLEDFEKNLKDNLYKLWNRMSSGSYNPPAVKAVPIPKKSGGTRMLGVPTVGDRIAQMVVKLVFEPEVESCFLPDSYGYRPNKSALDAIGITRERCWRNDWVLEFDIKGLFDNIPHDLLMKAVHKHTEVKWIILYIERWLKAPMEMPEGTEVERERGTPQGGVISPILSNLYLHYVFDKWMERYHKTIPWCRYADDGLLHCKTKEQAGHMLDRLKQRFEACGLELHPEKTRIVYCKDGRRTRKYPNKAFDFLGYEFRARKCVARDGKIFVGFNPAISKRAAKAISMAIRKSGLRNRTELNIQQIAKWHNPILQGWLNYYGRYRRSAMYRIWRIFNGALVRWVMRKYKRFWRRKARAIEFLIQIAKTNPKLFVHWRKDMIGLFV